MTENKKKKRPAARPIEPESTHVASEVATIPVKRLVSKDGNPPLVLTQQVGGGNLRNGRHFDVLLGMGSGALIVYLDPVLGENADKARMYQISPRDMLDAIIAKDFPEL